VGDTVGDPFKDTSGPALNILLKLMSMVSLTIAPLIKLSDDPDAKLDYKNFYFGFIPLVVFVAVTMNLVVNKILTWEDPLGNLIPSEVKVEENQLAEPEKEEDLNSTC
jgi:hypothetical protein